MALTRVTSQVLDSNAVSAAKLANGAVTARHFANLSVELRHLAPDANVVLLHSDLTTNVNSLQTNLNATTANINIVTSNLNSLTTRVNTIDDNTFRNSQNIAVNAANTIQLLANLNQTSTNVAQIIDGTTPFTGEVTMNDDLIVTGNLIINGATTTANSVNMVVEDRMMMLANSVSGSPSADVGMLFNRGSQGNAAFFYDESGKTFKIADTQDPASNTVLSPVTLGNLAVGTLTFNGADLNTAITDNVNTLTTNINTLDANADGIDARLAANVLVSASNDFVTFTRLNANINVVQDNIVASTAMIPFVNVITTAGSNAVGMGVDTTSDANVVTVTMDGVVQANTEFVMNHTTNVLQFKDASIPSGTIVTIYTLA